MNNSAPYYPAGTLNELLCETCIPRHGCFGTITRTSCSEDICLSEIVEIRPHENQHLAGLNCWETAKLTISQGGVVRLICKDKYQSISKITVSDDTPKLNLEPIRLPHPSIRDLNESLNFYDGELRVLLQQDNPSLVERSRLQMTMTLYRQEIYRREQENIHYDE